MLPFNKIINAFEVCLSARCCLHAEFLATESLLVELVFQIRAARAGLDNLVIPDAAAIKRAYDTHRSGGGGGVLRTAPSPNKSPVQVSAASKVDDPHKNVSRENALSKVD